ncbi:MULTISPECIES: SDR family NAD(P)-dependent oxidoreductase [Paracoccus]|jgi:NAD(P)-dependent dehydrogenase (short-subunit alcohol dehydrogenase family)|uniref:Short-chain dehydrogenase/reductase SDR n=1 Tax=Paracoccus denitrificans (strain Pd 1222) TaxID=318586 RepID=A1BBI9_PARDP|nr:MULTISPECIES: SDR family oxidoreductase [Paracoccus]ABL72883.1 short-chain dehydrogenase/reductase SDR [Paracoccus denitrificans PD1222]MBB4626362.1 NAD(P)-dependent dehydrogenase (short-subunit alcohol dehydrogenase family) [Paracoccus denitrificans]MCU7427433.1 SDR family oxidoreductase [Paracoccus denitrificans]MDK8871211.1 SDR family oxidoreductase [Paracoccus sp. SSJ]QAR29292.1 SDR family oxidoreductase [Paracoccus denitrificans]
MKTAIVTGGCRGIGLAATEIFLEQGWRVAMVDRDTRELHRVADGMENVLAVEADVSDPDQVERMVAETVAGLGRIDALVNNAGVALFSHAGRTSFEEWREVMATNLDGVFLCTQATAPELAKTGGAIVNIASISGLRASTLRVAYGTSKAAVIHLTKQFAAELGEQGIRVNCVAPGPVRTKLAMAVHAPEIISAYYDAIPLNRYGEAREIAEAIVFLCSDKASFVSGQTLAVDGGFDATGVGLPALRRENEPA